MGMAVPDRIPCINPNCRRTASREKYPGATNIICGKCWRAIPDQMRKRWKQLKSRWKKISRAMRKRSTDQATWNRIVDQVDGAWDRLNTDIVHYFTASEKPIGIEDFLKENGLV